LDKVRSKRAVIAVGASIVILSAFILAFWPRLPSVFIALVLQGAMLREFRRRYFGKHKRLTKERCEEFFSNDANFIDI
jgi:hypothetical protein